MPNFYLFWNVTKLIGYKFKIIVFGLKSLANFSKKKSILRTIRFFTFLPHDTTLLLLPILWFSFFIWFSTSMWNIKNFGANLWHNGFFSSKKRMENIHTDGKRSGHNMWKFKNSGPFILQKLLLGIIDEFGLYLHLTSLTVMLFYHRICSLRIFFSVIKSLYN